MPKGRSLAVLLFSLMFLTLHFTSPAAEEGEEEGGGEEIPTDPDWSGYAPSLYARGDQVFVITLGLILPSVFGGAQSGVQWFFDSHLKLGGTGSLAYNHFLGPHFYVGGEVGGMFAGTLEENMYYAVPFGLRAGYQVVLGRFEFPFSLLVGAIPQKYRDRGYFGLIVKPGASVFWRFNTDWSFGFNAAWWWVPQWTSIPAENVHGNFLELTISARYHF